MKNSIFEGIFDFWPNNAYIGFYHRFCTVFEVKNGRITSKTDFLIPDSGNCGVNGPILLHQLLVRGPTSYMGGPTYPVITYGKIRFALIPKIGIFSPKILILGRFGPYENWGEEQKNNSDVCCVELPCHKIDKNNFFDFWGPYVARINVILT